MGNCKWSWIGLKKNSTLSVDQKRALIESTNSVLTIKEQCSLIELNLSSYYYHPLGITEEELELMAKIDRIYTKIPFYGVRKITEELRRQGDIYNHKRIGRLMHLMGIQVVTPKRNLSKPNKDHLVYPYLLRDVKITETNQVWSTDITYLPIHN